MPVHKMRAMLRANVALKMESTLSCTLSRDANFGIIIKNWIQESFLENFRSSPTSRWNRRCYSCSLRSLLLLFSPLSGRQANGTLSLTADPQPSFRPTCCSRTQYTLCPLISVPQSFQSQSVMSPTTFLTFRRHRHLFQAQQDCVGFFPDFLYCLINSYHRG